MHAFEITQAMEQTTTILNGYSDQEKGAYLGAIASIATADRKASPEEIEYLSALSEAAGISEPQAHAVVKAATDLSSDELKRCLDVLKNSNLKYSLVADLITFAKVDQQYLPDEKANVEKISQYLEVDKQQFSLLDQFVDKATDANTKPEDVQRPGFFESLGFKDKFQNAGINMGALSKGLLSIAGPMILSRLLTGGLGGRRASPFNNRMPMPGAGGMGGFGGLGSLFSMLNGGRNPRSMGSLLPGLFR
jgi:uncharacterized tellurite resistance protein B-like protein